MTLVSDHPDDSTIANTGRALEAQHEDTHPHIKCIFLDTGNHLPMESDPSPTLCAESERWWSFTRSWQINDKQWSDSSPIWSYSPQIESPLPRFEDSNNSTSDNYNAFDKRDGRQERVEFHAGPWSNQDAEEDYRFIQQEPLHCRKELVDLHAETDSQPILALSRGTTIPCGGKPEKSLSRTPLEDSHHVIPTL